MAVSSAFLWRFLDDVWDLLPTEDRDLFEAYWKGFVRVGGDLQQKAMEANVSLMTEHVPVHLTDRWARYVMDDETADIFPNTESIAMAGVVPEVLAYETVFYHTLVISNATRNIVHTENVQFFDNAPKQLRYGDIVPGTMSVRLAEQQFTRNRDFVLSERTGEIQRTSNSRMPADVLIQISYGHEVYVEDIDYVVDTTNQSIARTSDSTIPDSVAVNVAYDYNGTATIPLQGVDGAVLSDLSTFEAAKNNFGAVTPGRTLSILNGPNIGTYTINAVLTSTRLRIGGVFPAVQNGDVRFTIDAYPHAMRVDKSIVSIPSLQSLVDSPTVTLVEGIDYRVSNGILASRSAFPLKTLGPEERRDLSMWAEVTKINAQTPYRNFGVLIDFFRTNSEAYKLALQGLWFTFWTGSTHGNIVTGLHILLGLPFAKNAGSVVRVSDTQIDVEDGRGQIITYTIPSGLVPLVERGDEVDRFGRLTNGVQAINRINEPGFVANRLGRAGISRFLTSNASRGPGNTDETKALVLLENHLFLPQIIAEAVTSVINVSEFVTFLNNMKPQWTEFIFSFAVEEDETIYVEEDEIDVDPTINLTTTVASNEFNQGESADDHLLSGANGSVLGAGTQATGNFQDTTRDFAASSIGEGSLIRIDGGTFNGFHMVLERFSTTLLAIDIPDVDLVSESGLDWVAVTAERARLNHDAPTLGDSHIVVAGTAYATPTTLNVKTDADFDAVSLGDEDVKAMLLIDIAIAGAEVQAITDADVSTGEIQVGTAPAGVPLSQAHEIASASIVRVDNGGPTVTDAVAI